MTKIFISVGMRGRNNDEVLKDLDRAKKSIYNIFNDDLEIYHNFNCEDSGDHRRLYYLGEAIKKLGECDTCYFVEGWKNHNGCKAEYEICKLYNIRIIEES